VVPPLRDRKDDLPALIDHFLARLSPPGQGARSIAPEALAALEEYHWPGNVRELQNVIERMLVRAQGVVRIEDVPREVRQTRQAEPAHVEPEYRRTIADDLYQRITSENQSFWSTVYPLFMQREITRTAVRDVVRKGLQESRGNYKIVARMFNMEEQDYKKFLNFLRKHQCQPSFKEFR
jgi:DNA-binding NtrC family response regulator